MAGIRFSASEEMNAQLIELNKVERQLVGNFAKLLANNDANDQRPAPTQLAPAGKTAPGKSKTDASDAA